jgi:surface protein
MVKRSSPTVKQSSPTVKMTEIQENSLITKWCIIGDDKTLSLPLIESGSYDFLVDWGDGTQDHITTCTASHTYPSHGTYQVSITGLLKGWRARDTPGFRLLDVCQWGCIKLGNEGHYFDSCSEMDISATDAPDLSETMNLGYMFYACMRMNGRIGHWDVSSVTDMECMFCGASSFNQPLASADGGWDVSSVTSMVGMFFQASSFNQPLASWDVSSVTNIDGMFLLASSFNQSLASWDVSSVTNMWGMFKDATAFINGPHLQELQNWNVSSPTVGKNLLGRGKGIHFRHNCLILMTWAEWIKRHPNNTPAEYTCPICLMDLAPDESWRALTCPATMKEGIPHCFHKECIEGCYTEGGSNICPVCRRGAKAIKVIN